jgi:hypothetical protein
MNTILGLGGIWSLMVGINATKEIRIEAIEAIRSLSPLFWKKIPKFITASNQRGRKIVANETYGNLYNGTQKCPYWKC